MSADDVSDVLAAASFPFTVPDLSITKVSDASGAVRAGDTITYTIDVENIGTTTQTGISVEDLVPPGTSWVSTTVTAPFTGSTDNVRDTFSTTAYTNNDGSINWSNAWQETDVGGNGANGGNVSIVQDLGDRRIKIKSASQGAERTADLSAFSVATLTYSFRRKSLDDVNDYVSVIIDDGTTSVEVARHDGSVGTDPAYISQSIDVSSYIASGTTTIRLLSSAGLGNGDNVFFDDIDIFAAGRGLVTFPGNPPTTLTSGLDLWAGESLSIDLVVLVDTPVALGITSITNTATVFSDVETAGQSASATNPLERINDLVLTKVDTVDPILAGQPLGYTLGVTNNGIDISTNTMVTDTLPANVTFVSATPGQGSCSESGGVVTCLLGDIAIGGSTGVAIVVTPTGAAAGTTITNNAIASADPTELVPADNTASEDTDVLAAADLAITKVDTIDPAFTGVPFTYTVTVTNGGPNTATNVVMTDALPVGVAYSSAVPDQGSCSEAAGVITCSVGSIAAAGSVDIVVTVIPDVSVENTTITNNASVASDVADPVPGNNSTSEDTDIDPSADLHVTKADDTDPVLVNGTLTYTVSVLNEGVSGATNVVLTDALPGGVAFVSATPGQGSCSESGGTVTCLLGSIAASATVDVVVVVTPGASVGNTTITNNASVVGDEFDPDASDNSTSEDTDVDPRTDLELTKVATPDPVLAGEQLTFTIIVDNNGPSDSTGGTITDVLPAGVTFNAGASSGSCSELLGTVTCTVGAIVCRCVGGCHHRCRR